MLERQTAEPLQLAAALSAGIGRGQPRGGHAGRRIRGDDLLQRGSQLRRIGDRRKDAEVEDDRARVDAGLELQRRWNGFERGIGQLPLRAGSVGAKQAADRGRSEAEEPMVGQLEPVDDLVVDRLGHVNLGHHGAVVD